MPSIPHIHPHLFRHTRAMHLYMAGMPLETVSQWLGHSQLETSLIYARATTEMKRAAVAKIASKENSVFKAVSYTHLDVYKRQLFDGEHGLLNFLFSCQLFILLLALRVERSIIGEEVKLLKSSLWRGG